MPTVTLVSGPPGSGKTHRLADAVAAAAGEAPFTRALVLVPTQRHADQFRRHLAQRAGALFDLTVTTIPNLAATVLAVLAFAQVMPASANTISLTNPYCSTSGGWRYSTSTTGSYTTSIVGASCWRYVAQDYVDPTSGDWIANYPPAPQQYTVSKHVSSSLTGRAFHSVFNSNQQGLGGWTYSWLH